MQRLAPRVYSTVNKVNDYQGKITKDEFTASLRQIWSSAGTDQTPIAMAISGGVDSMALAAMMRRYVFPDNATALHACVVDHGLREDSTREASWVRDQLQDGLGIEARVLSRRNGAMPMGQHEVRNELFARNLRYGLLQEALAQRGIKKLLIAHHAGDQHETFLYRLSQGHRQGLTGINSVSSMQRFWGDGSRTGHLSLKSDLRLPQNYHGESTRPMNNSVNGIMGFGDPPVTLLRPLFDFTKARLRATCEHLGVEWVEDPTNHERTHTTRNAIRHIVGHYRLPAALQPSSTRQVQERLQNRRQTCESRAAAFLERCKNDLDVSTGRLMFAFRRDTVDVLDAEGHHGTCSQHTSAKSLVLRQCLSVVTDHEVPLRAFDSVGDALIKAQKLSTEQSLDVHTRGGFRFSQSDVSQNRRGKFKHLDAEDWTMVVVERAPIEQKLLEPGAESKQSGLFIGLPLRRQEPESNCSNDQSSQTRFFHYWDNRYWIRASLENLPEKTPGYLLVRPLAEGDLASLKAMCEDPSYTLFLKGHQPIEHGWKYIKEILKQRAPGKLRFTLPIVEYVNAENPGHDMLLALPSFGLSFGAAQNCEPTDGRSIRHKASTTCDPVKLDFEIRFKHVGPIPGHCLEEVV